MLTMISSSHTQSQISDETHSFPLSIHTSPLSSSLTLPDNKTNTITKKYFFNEKLCSKISF